MGALTWGLSQGCKQGDRRGCSHLEAGEREELHPSSLWGLLAGFGLFLHPSSIRGLLADLQLLAGDISSLPHGLLHEAVCNMVVGYRQREKEKTVGGLSVGEGKRRKKWSAQDGHHSLFF